MTTAIDFAMDDKFLKVMLFKFKKKHEVRP